MEIIFLFTVTPCEATSWNFKAISSSQFHPSAFFCSECTCHKSLKRNCTVNPTYQILCDSVEVQVGL